MSTHKKGSLMYTRITSLNPLSLPMVLFCTLMFAFGASGQTVTINGAGAGRTFDGVGGVSGGGATSALLMSYPEPQRSQILDYLFKPNFGASLQTHFCEVPGDVNATQGSESSHMHAKTDENYQRGYEWFIMKEAYKRNPAITFDAVAWGCPGWVGGGQFWSTDMQDYYIKWIKGLKTNYGITLDAIGCRNESGSNYDWAIAFHNALNTAGLGSVRLHGFDNWNGVTEKWGVADAFATNASLKTAIDIVSAHTTINTSWSETKVDATTNAINSGKQLWDTEEHYMNQNSGYNQATAEVQAFNQNYIRSKVTKTLFWYLIDCTYPIEAWTNYGCMTAKEPWSGFYQVKEGVWGFAHYNQFVKIGWQFIDGACGNISGNANNGSYVTLKSPDNADFSVIIETKSATAASTLTFAISGGLPTNKPLCVWRSTGTNDLFVKQADIPAGASFSITVNANAIYSISTTTGQQKGTVAAIPASQAFPLPYYENFDHYGTGTDDQKLWGYYAYHFADVCGVFEIANSPTGTGKCLRQVLNTKANSWAPEWAPFTIIGAKTWTDYEVSADVYFDGGGWASIFGRISGTMGGYGAYPQGYYLQLASGGAWNVMYATNTQSSEGNQLGSGTVALTSGQWNNLKLRMQGTTLTAFIKGTQVWTGTASNSGNGLAGLGTGNVAGGRNTAMFDNLIINTVNGATPQPTVFPQDANPPYGPAVGVTAKPAPGPLVMPDAASFKIIGNQMLIPKGLAGKTVSCAVYNLDGTLVQTVIATGRETIIPHNGSSPATGIYIVKAKVVK